MNRKKLSIILAAVMILALLAGCAGDKPDAGQNAPDQAAAGDADAAVSEGPMELVIGCQNDIGSMYPFGSATSGVKTKRVMVYETLFWLDYDGELQPILAKSYESLGGGKYSVELFDYIYDSEGNHMTASDIVYTLDRYIEDGQNLATYATLTEYYATGDYTLEFVYEPETVGQFVTLITNMHCVTQAAWEGSGDEMSSYPIGTAGYVLVPEESTAGSIYVFKKRDSYWQTDERYICDYNKNTLDKLTAKIITDTSTLAIALETGEIDFAADIASADQGLFTNADGTAADGYIMLEGTNNAFTHLLFNAGPNSPTRDINLRKAISYAIDAAACSYAAYGVFGQVCFAATNPGLSDADENMGNGNYFPYDVARAKELVAQSAYKGETLKMLVQPIKTVSDSAPLIQQYCAEIGVNIELLEYDMALYRTTRTDETGLEYDIELYGAAGAGDVYVYTSLKELDGKNYRNGVSHVFTEDPELQRLYNAASDVETHSAESVKAFLDYLEEQCYVYGIYYCPKLFFGHDFITYARTVIYLDAVYTAFVVDK
ncbi:MAG: ABC transporter substrate-binding protein [Clostridiales Family XIII bacterium]|nr:ABC transporter substrate-binding protein [Clostridiales Family XIII bacterium]